jgi:hypothetical protein
MATDETLNYARKSNLSPNFQLKRLKNNINMPIYAQFEHIG